MAKDKMKQCCFCERSINMECGGVGDDFVAFNPCLCISCPKCALKRFCNRKYNSIECPNHHKEFTEAMYFESSRSKRAGKTSIKIERYTLDIGKEPGRVFTREYQKNAELMKNKMFLNLTFTHRFEDEESRESSYAPSTITAILDSKFGFESEEDECNLRKIFGFLHDPIMKHHYTTELKDGKAIPRMTPAEFCEYCLEQDESLLLKLLFALSTGQMQFTPHELTSKGNRNMKAELSRFLAVCVAKSMIERVNNHRPGPLQLMIGDMLSIVNAPTHQKEFLAKIRLSSGRRTTDRHILRRYIKNAFKRVKLKPLDFYCLHFDNFGFKGKKGQWKQHTVIQIAKIPEEKLRKLGFYDGYKIDRVRKSMEELLEESDELDVADRIVKPSRMDYEILSRRVLTTIQTVAGLQLPTVAECRQILDSEECVPWPYSVPANLGVQIETNKEKNSGELSIDTIVHNPMLENLEHLSEENDNQPFDLPSTFYEKNDITIDEVLHGDPGSHDVIKKIVEYMEEAAFVDDYDVESSGGETPVRGIIAAATADGGPSKRWLDFQAQDIDEAGSFENRKYKLPRVFLAGFHFMMEFLTMRGRLSRTYTSYFARKWRPKDPQLDWIYVIRDPNEALSEWREYLLAHYRTAAESAETNDPVQIHEYMLKRAIEIPTCMAILLDLRLLEILFMIRDSEKAGTHGDVPLFLTCMRLSLPLFAVTHARNYCHLICDFLEWFHLASDAEKVLFENFFYTKLTPNGKPIWADRGVEWTVRHIRMFMGHRVRSNNHDEAVERIVGEIPFRIRAKRDIRYLLGSENHKGYTTLDWNEQKFHIGTPFLETRVALEETNFWGTGPLRGDFESNSVDSIVLEKSIDDGKEHRMSSSLLRAFDLGVDRIRAYFVEHHLRQRYPTTRSEDNVSLKVLPTTHERRENDREKLRICWLSIKEEEIDSLKREFPKRKLVEDLNHLREFFFADIPPYKESDKRSILVAALCRHRKRYFTEYPEIYQETKERLDELDASEAATTRTSREEQIISTIYSLDTEVVNEFRHGVPYDNL